MSVSARRGAVRGAVRGAARGARGGAARGALALLCALCVAHSLALAHHKRDESEPEILSPAPFTFAARYGRSPGRLITPRNDRWLMTTRYGKRSGSSVQRSQLGPASPREGGGGAGLAGEGRALHCEYTGVLTLYRCSPSRTDAGPVSAPAPPPRYDRRDEADQAAGAE